jgi:hypothetical protein
MKPSSTASADCAYFLARARSLAPSLSALLLLRFMYIMPRCTSASTFLN